ncbi:patatin-like phospholipase family protein [Calderihabitans maritimus]|uniref:patatin-like phospholipase family protein n=1 Tax=Calderihabitans maritimus TaxID=1246530 RepID=UPI000B504D1B|nr:patatin-like phospholipase family protein [Calderihabitans maritimus]
MGNEPTVGLALGAGAARGMAHLGVLQVLEEAQIPVHLIAGSSIGSVFGALYACGSDLKMLEKLAVELKSSQFIDLTVPRIGLIKGQKVEALLNLLTKKMTFDELRIPFYAVAVDIEKGEKVVINKGSVAEAVRASIAIPGIFHPKRLHGRVLVDGAVLERIPVSVLREQGAEVIIAVDVKYGGTENQELKAQNIFDIMLHAIDLLDREVVKHKVLEADVIIQPDLAHIGPTRFDLAAECIALGREAALDALPSIKQVLEQRRNTDRN